MAEFLCDSAYLGPGNPNILILPEGAIIYRAEGTQVAKVINNHAHLVNVTVGINFGTTVQVLSGITKDDRVVANPTADLLEGDEVRIVPTTPGYNTPGKALQDADQQPVRQHDANPEEAGSR